MNEQYLMDLFSRLSDEYAERSDKSEDTVEMSYFRGVSVAFKQAKGLIELKLKESEA